MIFLLLVSLLIIISLFSSSSSLVVTDAAFAPRPGFDFKTISIIPPSSGTVTISKVSSSSSSSSGKRKQTTFEPEIKAPPVFIIKPTITTTTTTTTQSFSILVCSQDKTVSSWKIDSSSLPKLQWSITSFSSSSRATPIVMTTDQQAVIVLSFQDGSLAAVKSDDASILWTQKDASKSWGFSPTLLKTEKAEIIFAGFRDAKIAAIDAKTGAILGNIEQSDGVWASPLVVSSEKKLFYAQTASARIGCVDLNSFMLSLSTSSSTSSLSASWFYDIVPNAKHWKEQTPHWIWPSPVRWCVAAPPAAAASSSENNKCFIVFGSVDGFLRIVDEQNGKLIFKTKPNQSGISLNAIVTSDRFSLIVAYDDGDFVWIQYNHHHHQKKENHFDETFISNTKKPKGSKQKIIALEYFGSSVIILVWQDGTLQVVDVDFSRLSREVFYFSENYVKDLVAGEHEKKVVRTKIATSATIEHVDDGKYYILIGFKSGEVLVAVISASLMMKEESPSPLLKTSEAAPPVDADNFSQHDHQSLLTQKREIPDDSSLNWLMLILAVVVFVLLKTKK